MKIFGKPFLYIIETIVIAALAVWFVWKDPLRIFTPHKIHLGQTALEIENIRAIGKLVTAEYYGEVIASLPESKLSEDKNFYASMVADLYDTLIYSVYRIDSVVNKLQKPLWKREYKLFYQYYQEIDANLRSNLFYFPMVIYLDSIYEYEVFNDPVNFKKVGDYKNDLEKYEEPVIKQLWNRIHNKKDPPQISFVNFYRTYEKYIKHSPFKSERKKEILLLGKGWVKAGIDFETISPYNFKYIKEKKIVHFYHVLPIILYYDINPWLVPGKVPGFEYIKIAGKATNPEDIVSVKNTCIEKLKQQAIDCHILEKAKENAGQNLRTFFSVLTGEEIRQVKFIFSKYEAYHDLFSGDILNASQYLSFDTLYKKDFQTLDTTWYSSMTTQLNELDTFFRQVKTKKKVLLFDKTMLPITKYTALAVKITSDHKVDTTEMTVINMLYNEEIIHEKFTKTDSIWYPSAKQRANDFYIVWGKILLPKFPANINKDLLKKLREIK